MKEFNLGLQILKTEEKIKALNRKIRQLQKLKKQNFNIPIDDLKICKKTRLDIIQSIYRNDSKEITFWKNFINKNLIMIKFVLWKCQWMEIAYLTLSLSSYLKQKNARQLRDSIVKHQRLHKKQQVVNVILSDLSETPEYVQYLKQHELDFEKLTSKKKFDIYLQLMNITGVYGQYLEIVSFCELFELNVIIFTDGNNVHIMTPNKPSEKNIFLFYHENLQHYDVLYIKPNKIF